MRFWGRRDRWLYGRATRTRRHERESRCPRGTFVGDPRKRPAVADRRRRTRGAAPLYRRPRTAWTAGFRDRRLEGTRDFGGCREHRSTARRRDHYRYREQRPAV